VTRRLLPLLLLLVGVLAPPPVVAQEEPFEVEGGAGGRVTAGAPFPMLRVRVTWYLPTGNVMYSGQYPFVGAAACSWNFSIGTRLRLPDGREVTCLDRGRLGSAGWVDIFVPTTADGRHVARQYGDWTTVVVVR
jgi:hypothetical protein